MSHDPMLSVLYDKAFQLKREVEALNGPASGPGDIHDRLRQVAIEKGKLLNDLIGIRTDQIRNGAE